jgi:hypothetical protein
MFLQRLNVANSQSDDEPKSPLPSQIRPTLRPCLLAGRWLYVRHQMVVPSRGRYHSLAVSRENPLTENVADLVVNDVCGPCIGKNNRPGRPHNSRPTQPPSLRDLPPKLANQITFHPLETVEQMERERGCPRFDQQFAQMNADCITRRHLVLFTSLS